MLGMPPQAPFRLDLEHSGAHGASGAQTSFASRLHSLSCAHASMLLPPANGSVLKGPANAPVWDTSHGASTSALFPTIAASAHHTSQLRGDCCYRGARAYRAGRLPHTACCPLRRTRRATRGGGGRGPASAAAPRAPISGHSSGRSLVLLGSRGLGGALGAHANHALVHALHAQLAVGALLLQGWKMCVNRAGGVR